MVAKNGVKPAKKMYIYPTFSNVIMCMCEDLRLVLTFFPMSEIFTLQRRKPIIIILSFSQALIEVNLRLVITHLNALFTTKTVYYAPRGRKGTLLKIVSLLKTHESIKSLSP